MRLFVAADGRPHAPWRIVLFIGITGLVGAVVGLLGTFLASPIFALTRRGDATEIISVAIALWITHWIMLKEVDKRNWSFVGLDADRARPIVLLRGALLGALPILLPSLAVLALGWFSLRAAADGPWFIVAAQVTLVLAPAALLEELLARGYIFATLREWLGARVALVLTSVAFGLMHIPNPGSDVRSVLMVTLAGFFLGAVLLVTGSLWAAWMAHLMWNWVMAVAMHSPVSGENFPAPDYRIVDSGPDWLTGGVWGPEGGAAAAAGMIAALVYLNWRFNKKQRTADPSLRSG